MYDDVACLRFTLETDGFDRFEAACLHEEDSVREFLLAREDIEEVLVLRTCQRYELYAYGPRAQHHLSGILEKLDFESADDQLLTGRAVVDHLFRVACGLESGVLGEDEILGQFREAYRRASEAETLGGPLDTIALKALRTGERARTETGINEGGVSLGSITVEYAREELLTFTETDDAPLDSSHALVVGAGDVGRQVLKALVHRGVDSVTVVNRTKANAASLAAQVDGDAIALSNLGDQEFATADLLVTATGADERLIGIGDLVGHELVVVDLANPRDVDPAVDDLEDVRLVSIDEVLSVRNEGLERRERAVPAVEALIEEERQRLGEQLRAERVDGALDQIYSQSHALREDELDRALDRLRAEGEPLSETQTAVMRDFSTALINKLLHPKTSALRQAAATDDRETLDAWLTLFDQKSARQQESRDTPEQAPSGQSTPSKN